MAERMGQADDRRIVRTRRWAITAAVVILPFFFVRTYVVSARSMEPTLLPGDVVVTLAIPFVDTPSRGEVWVVREHGRVPVPLIKRVRWVAGDTVAVENAEIANARGLSQGNAGEIEPKEGEGAVRAVVALAGGEGEVVPAGTVYVVGDNPLFSVDSRQFGFIDEKYLGARVVAVVFSYGGAERGDSFGRGSVRWNRIARIVR